MYSIFCDGVCIHHDPSPDENLKVLEPKLKLSDNAAGTLTFKIPPNNVGYDNIHRLTSNIVVKRKNFSDTYNKVVYEEIWSGRVIEEKEDFWKNREVTCEGELGYLNDTTQPPNEYHDITPTNFLKALISIHNSKCEESKRFTVGVVTVTDPNDSLYRYTNFESTYEAIKDKLLDRLGGHLRIRKENNVRYLDYLQDYPSVNTQTIEFGKNLVEFSKNFNASELVTAIVPLGCNVTELDMEPTYDALEEYLTVESVNDGSVYVSSPEAVSNYGWIETVVHWNDVHDPSILLSKARSYLSDAQFEDMTLELSAVDLHGMDIHTEAIWLLDKIRCISKPHGMNRIFPIVKIDIPLDKPEDTKYTLGEKVKSTGISASVRDTNAQIIKKIDELPTTSSVLRQAKEESLELLNMKTNGFITITTEEDQGGKYHSDSLYISDVKDITASNRYWKWNMNGLAYYKNKSELGLALTMDGTIVANRILTGTLGKPEWGNYWNMETGEFILSPTNVKTDSNTTLSSYFDGKINTYDGTLDQQKVFNRLTNNGQTQGIYLSGGKVYINGEYIKANSVSANLIHGGKIVSNNNTMTIDLDNNKITCNNLIINSTNFKINSSGNVDINGTFSSLYTTYGGNNIRKVELTSGGLDFYWNGTKAISMKACSGGDTVPNAIPTGDIYLYGNGQESLHLSTYVPYNTRETWSYIEAPSDFYITSAKGNIGIYNGDTSCGFHVTGYDEYIRQPTVRMQARASHVEATNDEVYISSDYKVSINCQEFHVSKNSDSGTGYSGWFSNGYGFLKDTDGYYHDLKFINGILVENNIWHE